MLTSEWGENSAQSTSVSADATSEWGENSEQSTSVSADATSEWGENSEQSTSVSADATSEWGENSAQSTSVSADATSEWEAPFLNAQRGAGVEKPQNTSLRAPGQELGKRELQKREATDE